MIKAKKAVQKLQVLYCVQPYSALVESLNNVTKWIKKQKTVPHKYICIYLLNTLDVNRFFYGDGVKFC